MCVGSTKGVYLPFFRLLLTGSFEGIILAVKTEAMTTFNTGHPPHTDKIHKRCGFY